MRTAGPTPSLPAETLQPQPSLLAPPPPSQVLLLLQVQGPPPSLCSKQR